MFGNTVFQACRCGRRGPQSCLSVDLHEELSLFEFT